MNENQNPSHESTRPPARAVVEVTFKEGKKKISLELKQPEEIHNCKEGVAVFLRFDNAEVFEGFFNGIVDDDETILLKAFNGKPLCIGLPLDRLHDYFEQIDN